MESLNAIALYGQPIHPIFPMKFVPIPPERLKIAPKGTIYMLKLNVSDLTNEKAAEALNTLAKDLKEKFGITLLYGKATKNEIHLQIKGSPFNWLALLAWLPTILGLLGITLFAVSIWQAIAAIPSWVWATLAISVALILFGPPIGELILQQIERR
ncbi:MAG: hypothetical protein QXR62_04625 [Candidatus Bathyarchaeia archaeon]